MKEWSYYSTTNIDLPNFQQIKKDLIAKIDETPLTKDQREEAMKDVVKQANAIYAEASKPYKEVEDALAKEFWQDCREDFGYDKYLDKEGIAALEYAAYERGHSDGFSDIYRCLEDLVEFVNKIKNHILYKE